MNFSFILNQATLFCVYLDAFAFRTFVLIKHTNSHFDLNHVSFKATVLIIMVIDVCPPQVESMFLTMLPFMRELFPLQAPLAHSLPLNLVSVFHLQNHFSLCVTPSFNNPQLLSLQLLISLAPLLIILPLQTLPCLPILLYHLQNYLSPVHLWFMFLLLLLYLLLHQLYLLLLVYANMFLLVHPLSLLILLVFLIPLIHILFHVQMLILLLVPCHLLQFSPLELLHPLSDFHVNVHPMQTW